MTRKACFALLLVLTCAFPALAQKITVTGTVYEPEGEPAIGASVAVAGLENVGVVTDYDGNYTIQVEPNASLVFSYIGCDPQTIAVEGRTQIDVHLATNSVALQEVVAIGYGTVKKADATGSVGIVKPNEIEAGLAATAQDLLVGASPGVVVSTNGGDPAGGASIQIRGGASLNASNDPLIVIDGVPMDGNTVQGSSNPLSLVNPENIEAMTILKSASATAIYGSRASNGVIIITTKKGQSGRPQVSFAANFNVNTPRNYLDMMNGDQYRSFISNYFGEGSNQMAALGQYNTNWQKEVLRTSFSHDYTLSVGGKAGVMPYRASVGYSSNKGIIRETGQDRLNAGFNLNPTFFDELLSVNAAVKGAYIRNSYDQGSLGGAVSFNPTLPVKNPEGNVFNNWTTYTDGGAVAGPTTPGTSINGLAAINPISLIDDYSSKSKVYQSVGNLQLDLKMPFLRELRANLNLGYDYSHGEVTNLNAAFSPQAWKDGFSVPYGDGSVSVKEGFTNRNKQKSEVYTLLLDFYLNYNKEFAAAMSSVDVTAGYSWQRFHTQSSSFNIVDPAIANAQGDFITNTNLNIDGFPGVANADGSFSYPLKDFAGRQFYFNPEYKSHYQLLSFFGRVNYSFMDRYLLTATVRRDGTSRFHESHRWGTFPSFALGWKILEENFMEGARGWMNELKLRLDYGLTGQQNIGSDYFPFLPVYTISSDMGNRYPVGTNGAYVNIAYPAAYFADLKWEETKTYNVGLDFGFMNNRINGSIDWYRRKTTDLLTWGPLPAGSNLSNEGWQNYGDLVNTGVEVTVNTRPIVTEYFRWSSNFNVAWNKNKITRLAEGVSSTTTSIGNAGDIQKQVVGYPAFSYYVYQQVYDDNGNPLEGVFVDQDGDGAITDADKILFHNCNPDVTVNWTNTFNYKNWDLGIVLRGSFGNWAYNGNQANNSFISAASVAPVSNLLNDVYLFESTRSTALLMSSYWVQNASFVRCDNITLGYTFDSLLQDKLRLRLFGAVQNPFVITKYKGLDPEVINSRGIDNSVYPRPITVTFGLVATF